jgi:hypothetical protein
MSFFNNLCDGLFRLQYDFAFFHFHRDAQEALLFPTALPINKQRAWIAFFRASVANVLHFVVHHSLSRQLHPFAILISCLLLAYKPISHESFSHPRKRKKAQPQRT